VIPSLALALARDLIRVLFRSRAAVIAEKSVPAAPTGSLSGAQDPPESPKRRREIRLGDPEPILPMGERSGDCQAGYVGPLAPSWIPSILALELSAHRASSVTQEPAHSF